MMGRSGAPAVDQPELQEMAAFWRTLKLLMNPNALSEAAVSFGEAAELYEKAKREADEQMATLGQERENFEALHKTKYDEFSKRDAEMRGAEKVLADKLLEVGQREAAIGAREAKLRAALA